MNSHTRRGDDLVETVAAPVVVRQWSGVVSLGRPAAAWARKVGFQDVFEGHHPAFWWAQRCAQPYPVARFLREIASNPTPRKDA